MKPWIKKELEERCEMRRQPLNEAGSSSSAGDGWLCLS